MISILVVLSILFVHWFADFIVQTDYEAQNKSKSNLALISHTYNYSYIWIIVGVSYLIFTSDINQPGFTTQMFKIFSFGAITFVIHTVTDYITSRINRKLWQAKQTHWFFVSVGFDQFLHFTQLLITYQFLFGA